MRDLTHEECSDRLEAYASDHLDQGARRDIDAHLADCPDCSLELVAVRALRAVQVEPMTGPERERVAHAVRAAVSVAPRRGLVERFGARFAPALGAVALVVIAAVALVSLPDSADSPSGSSAEGGADVARDDDAQTMESQAEAPAALPEQGKEDAVGGGGSAVGDSEAGGFRSQPGTTSEAQALNVRSNFTVVGESFSETGLQPGSLVPARVPRRGLDYFDAGPADLAALAPNGRVAGFVEECAARTIATSPHPVVPSSAAYYSDDVLVIGFVWLDPSASTFNYELRGWVGGDCNRISPIYRRGVLE